MKLDIRLPVEQSAGTAIRIYAKRLVVLLSVTLINFILIGWLLPVRIYPVFSLIIAFSLLGGAMIAISLHRTTSRTSYVKEYEAEVARLQKPTQSEIAEYSKEFFLLKSVREAGLYGIYSTRQDAFASFIKFLIDEPYEILVVGSSLLGVLKLPDKEYEEIRKVLYQRKESGVKVRFLLTHPKIADLRAQQENRSPKGIGIEIIDSLKILINEWKIPREDIRLYQGTPTCFGLRTGKAILLNVYPYMIQAYVSPCLIVLKGGYIYSQFDNSHFRAWTSSMALPVPSNLGELGEQLDVFAKNIQNLMDSSTSPTVSDSV